MFYMNSLMQFTYARNKQIIMRFVIIFVNIINLPEKDRKNTNKARKLTDRALWHHNVRALANKIVRYTSLQL